jgi:Lung seven transmembrane receptor
MSFARYVAAWLFAAVAVVSADFEEIDVSLGSTSPWNSLGFSTGTYVRAPGIIDLSGLTFRGLQRSNPDRLTSTLDIFITRFPKGCSFIQDEGCNAWSSGCCTEQAIAKGKCARMHHGELFVEKETFQGYHISVKVPHSGYSGAPAPLLQQNGRIHVDQSGSYYIDFNHCQNDDVSVYIKGGIMWKSKHGYVPSKMLGTMVESHVATLVRFAVLLWFGYCVYTNKEHGIAIEKWILASLALSFVSSSFMSLYYSLWNQTGHNQYAYSWIARLFACWLHGIDRSLLVMVSLGWGCVHGTLGRSMFAMVVLAAISIWLSLDNLQIALKMHVTHGVPVGSPLAIEYQTSGWMICFVDIVFAGWACIALRNTILYLGGARQTRLFRRYWMLQYLVYPAFALSGIVPLASFYKWYKVLDAVGYMHQMVWFGLAILFQPSSESGTSLSVENELETRETDESSNTNNSVELVEMSSLVTNGDT